MKLRRWLQRVRGRDEAGQSALEFALIVPYILIFLFFTVEGTNAVKTWMILQAASREGARCAAVQSTVSTIQTCACKAAGGTDCLTSLLTSSNVKITCSANCTNNDPSTYSCPTQGTTPCTDSVTVSIVDSSSSSTYTYTFQSGLVTLISGFTGGTISNTLKMAASTTMRLE